MAKYESKLRGNFDELLNMLNHGILKGSISASYEDGSDHSVNGVRCAINVYERHSIAGGSRVSLAVIVIGNGDDLFVSAITSGGSRAVFFKINTIGENSFLECAVDIIEAFKEIAGK